MNEEMYSEIASLRREIIENEFLSLNEMQQRAVYSVTGPLLILAGAGSGKTTVLVNRIAHILRWGEAYESDKLYNEYTPEEVQQIKLRFVMSLCKDCLCQHLHRGESLRLPLQTRLQMS